MKKFLSLLPFVVSIVMLFVSDAVAAPILQEGNTPVAGKSALADEVVRMQFLPILVKDLSPAVVNISVEADSLGSEEKESPEPVIPGNPFHSAGSGFIVRSDGYIITCAHVIDKADKVIVRLLDDKKKEHIAEIIGRDPKTDLALLKISAKKPLPFVHIGDSDRVQVGEWVVAIGNQFHLGQTVTTGIVSAKARKVPTRGSPYDSFLQTDASINPGSSGGPLFNARGQVVGINSAIFSPGQIPAGGTGFNIGIGFAVPVNLLKQIIGELESTGTVARGMLGVRVQAVDKSIQKLLGLKTSSGALVAEVLSGTPAMRAGLKRRDVITHFDGTVIEDFDQLPLLVANTKVGVSVELTVARKGKSLLLPAIIDELKNTSKGSREETQAYGARIGISVEELTEIQAKALGLEGAGGLFVRSVVPRSAADKAGIKKGDLIEEIGEVLVTKPAVMEKLLNSSAPGSELLFSVRNIDGIRILTLRLPKK